ncbi:MAG TPA: ATP-binding cassette domain-containing protein [Kofleriaceae bacterium]|nr:ATP-binding cassette domain-containing protein [Kofleriaceae bacterium]
MIAFKQVVKSFGGRPVLDGLDLEVRRGEVMFVVGTSGVGKSVTIKHLVGLLRVDAGEIWLDGARIDRLPERAFHAIRKRIAMVFQSATLFDSMRLVDNVALPLRKHRGLRDKPAREEARRRLDEVGLAHLADAFPHEVGDGVRKRAAIARALTLEPEVVLFDEPTTGLAPIDARRIDKLIRELADRRGVTAIVVSHDLSSIFAIADRIALLYQGAVRACGSPEAIRASADPVVQQFIHGRATGPMDTPGF